LDTCTRCSASLHAKREAPALVAEMDEVIVLAVAAQM
jgi:hypothetical protein